MNSSLPPLISALLTASLAVAAHAQTTAVDIAVSEFTVHASPDTTEGPFYTITVSPPQGIGFVRHAWLELRADVSVPERDGFRDPVPVFEVYMLNSSLSGEPTAESFEPLRLPMSRPVAVGVGRSVRIDVTEYVRRIMAAPSTNHGLVLGAVTGDRRADIRLKDDAFGSGIAARLVIVE